MAKVYIDLGYAEPDHRAVVLQGTQFFTTKTHRYGLFTHQVFEDGRAPTRKFRIELFPEDGEVFIDDVLEMPQRV